MACAHTYCVLLLHMFFGLDEIPFLCVRKTWMYLFRSFRLAWPGCFFFPPLWLCFVRLYVSRVVFVNDWEIFQSAPILLVIRSILCGWWRHCAAVNFVYIYFAVAAFLCRHSFHPQEIRRHRLWWRKLDWTSHIRTIMLTQFPGDGDNQATEDEQQHNEVILIGWSR